MVIGLWWVSVVSESAFRLLMGCQAGFSISRATGLGVTAGEPGNHEGSLGQFPIPVAIISVPILGTVGDGIGNPSLSWHERGI
jgi:hypothetical protein